MRLETQKQIVKAFSMLYEDTEMPLGELISKLQELNGGRAKDNLRLRESITNQQILDVFTPSAVLHLGQILESLGETKKSRISYQLKQLVKQRKINKKKINPKLCEYSLNSESVLKMKSAPSQANIFGELLRYNKMKSIGNHFSM